MTPKEKAKELVNKIYVRQEMLYDAKRCALICVDEKIKTASKGVLPSEFPTKEVLRLREVKKEIEKL